MKMLSKWILMGLLALPGAAGADDFEETLSAASGGTLRIDLPGGSIDIDTHDKESVEIDARVSGNMELDIRQDGDEVSVIGHSSGGFLGFLRSGRVRVHARVPEEFHLDLQTRGGHIDVQELIGHVVARTSGGHIDVQEIRGNVAAETSGGRIEGKEVEGDFFAATSGGSIRASEVGGRIDADTSGGSIRVSKAGDEVYAHTSGGSINVDFTAIPAGEIVTTGGSIEVRIPKHAGLHLRAKTSGGSVRLDDDFEINGRVDKSHVNADLNGGGPSLELDTSGGSIRVKAH
jgi:hypothetical protein